jgi:hypothetical protein
MASAGSSCAGVETKESASKRGRSMVQSGMDGERQRKDAYEADSMLEEGPQGSILKEAH